ncbi:MAG: hypothetical protein ACRD1R_07260 [Acidobacteriota bacterium]
MRRVRLVVGALVIGLLGNMSAASAEESDFDAHATVDGVEVPIVEGTVIYQGTPLPDGQCNIAEPISIGAEVPNELAETLGSHISITIADDCSLVVQDLAIGPEIQQTEAAALQVGVPLAKTELPGNVNTYVPNAAYDAQRTWKVYSGWVNSVMEEYANIHTTRSSDEMGYVTYFDGGYMYRVSNPRYIHNPNGDCWADSSWVWIIDRCEAKIWDEDPAQARFESWAHFHSSVPPRPDYTHHNMYNQFVGYWAYDCNLSQGVRPWGWNFICEGGRKLTATKP